MADRIHQLTVALEGPMTSEDAEAVFQAIKMVRGVVDVTDRPVPDAWGVQAQVVRELRARLLAVLDS